MKIVSQEKKEMLLRAANPVLWLSCLKVIEFKVENT